MIISNKMQSPGLEPTLLFKQAVCIGILGPDVTWGPNAPYRFVHLGFLVGAILPWPIFLIKKWRIRLPFQRHGVTWQTLSPALFLMGPISVQGWGAISMTSWALTGTLYHLILKRIAPDNFYVPLNYVLSAALTSGSAAAYFFDQFYASVREEETEIYSLSEMVGIRVDYLGHVGSNQRSNRKRWRLPVLEKYNPVVSWSFSGVCTCTQWILGDSTRRYTSLGIIFFCLTQGSRDDLSTVNLDDERDSFCCL